MRSFAHYTNENDMWERVVERHYWGGNRRTSGFGAEFTAESTEDTEKRTEG